MDWFKSSHDWININLHGEFVACVRASVDDVKGWNWHDDILDAGKVSNVTVEWDTFKRILTKSLEIIKIYNRK